MFHSLSSSMSPHLKSNEPGAQAQDSTAAEHLRTACPRNGPPMRTLTAGFETRRTTPLRAPYADFSDAQLEV